MRKYLIFPFTMFYGSLSFEQMDVLTYHDHENFSDDAVYREIRRRHAIKDEYACQGSAGIVVDSKHGEGSVWFLATGKYLGLHTYRDYLFGIYTDDQDYNSVLMLGISPLTFKYQCGGMTVCTSMPQKRMDDFLSLSAHGASGPTYEACYTATIEKINDLSRRDNA